MDVAEYVSYPRQNGKNMLRKALNALEAIQELHKPVSIGIGFSFTGGAEITRYACEHCTHHTEPGAYVAYPCSTRRLADEALNTI